MIDLKNYKTKKDQGLMAVAKVGDACAIYSKRFSQENGSEDTPVVVAIDVASLQDARARLQAQIQDINDVLADIEALKP